MHGALAQAVSGIYLGWASVGDSPEVYMMVMSIGWNPFYNNEVPLLFMHRDGINTSRMYARL